MGQSASACKPCNPANPAADTVKVDPAMLAPGQGSPANAEIQAPLAEERQAEEERQLAEEAEAKRQVAEEARQRQEEERQEAERRKAEEQERRLQKKRAEEEAREKKRQQELAAKAAKEAEERAAELERQKQEEEKERLKQEELQAQKTVDEYLKKNSFKGIKVPRKAMCGNAMLPLHVAIEEGNIDIVQALLLCGADPDQKSSGKTALQIAERCNKNGSHEFVVAAVRGAKANRGGA